MPDLKVTEQYWYILPDGEDAMCRAENMAAAIESFRQHGRDEAGSHNVRRYRKGTVDLIEDGVSKAVKLRDVHADYIREGC